MLLFHAEDCDGAVHVPSTWRGRMETSNRRTQTTEITYADKEVQSVQANTVSTQTTSTGVGPGEELNSAESKQGGAGEGSENALPDDVAEFVLRVSPWVEDQLEENLRSTAFAGYELQPDDDGAEEVSLKFTLHVDFARWGILDDQEDVVDGVGRRGGAAGSPTHQSLQTTGLSWNATGATLAASFGRFDMPGWCELRGAVCLWNIFGRSFDPRVPDRVLDHGSCLMCVACHPAEPGIVAAGSFSGEVVVWNASLTDEPLLGASPVDEKYHRDPVMGISWVYDDTRREHLLASVSGDGNILYWTLENSLFEPVGGMQLQTGSATSRARRRTGAGATIGGTALDFSSQGAASVVVGSEGGKLVRCTVHLPAVSKAELAQRRRDGQRADLDLAPATMFALEPHIGPIHAVDCSPFHRNAFYSCGADGCVHLHNMIVAQPVMTWVPGDGRLYDVHASRVRPTVFATAGDAGEVHVFDLSQNTVRPVSVLSIPDPDADDGADNALHSAGLSRRGASNRARSLQDATGASADGPAALSVQFNHKQRDFLAVGDALGRVHVYRLSWQLANRSTTELQRFQELLDT